LPSRASSLWTRPDSPQRTSFARRLSHKPWSLVPTHNGCQSRCVRSAANGFRPPRASDLPRRGEAPLVLDHKQFPVRQVCATATAGSAPLPDDRFHVSRRRGPRDRNGDGAIVRFGRAEHRTGRSPSRESRRADQPNRAAASVRHRPRDRRWRGCWSAACKIGPPG
jgi:hypothetical protein